MELWSQLCFSSLGGVADEAMGRKQLVVRSRVFLAPTEQPAAWEHKATHMEQLLLLQILLTSPDTVFLLLVFAESSIIPRADWLVQSRTWLYYSVESVWMVARTIVTRGECNEVIAWHPGLITINYSRSLLF